MKNYMVVENFKADKYDAVYERYAEKGRMLPDGLFYVDSWTSRSANRCFQLMKTDDHSLFATWIESWSDLVDFDVIEID